MASGVYVWKLNGIPKYVGRGMNVSARMVASHRECSTLYEAINKYGYDSFEKKVIRYCNPEELQKWETYYIRKFHTLISEGGFNCNDGRGGVLEHAPEVKKEYLMLSLAKTVRCMVSIHLKKLGKS